MSGEHLDGELLAGTALGQDDLRADQLQHLEGCPDCAATLAELHRLLDEVAEADPRRLLVPDPGLLGRIRADLADDPAEHPRSDGERDVAADLRGPARGPSRRPPARWRVLVAAAAVAGLVVGAAGGVLASRLAQPSTQLLASTRLTALPGWTGDGTAQLVRDGDVDLLRVRIDAPNPQAAFRELWLINTDGQRMVSLGVLDPSGQGTYPLPAVLSGNLQGYVLVDVSAEPFDGNPAHSHDSIVRGRLP